ncbi:MAG: ammonium transporter [Cytophagales bacterium]|nr:ammonium transporter [Cytophagales bacterium]
MSKKVILSTIMTMVLPIFAFAEETATLSAGDTSWMLISTALVILMTPAGLALFYGGLSQSKHVLNTMGMSYMAFCVATLVWVVFGYSLTFSGGNGFIGDFDLTMLKNIKVTDLEGSIPKLLHVAFQGTFAAIAVAIVSGSIVERMRFSTWLIFSALWTLVVYVPVAHWIWGGGFLSNDGELDFAGGTVIHVNAGIAGLVLSYLLGKRKDHGVEEVRPSSIKLIILGSALLWFGWFGFNAGSAGAADFIAANALLVTNVAACAGGMAWLLIEWFEEKRPTLIGCASGVISGLVAITPAAGYVDTPAALAMGALGGIVGYVGVVKLKSLLGYDDTLDAFGIHGLVGIFGALATGFFANPDVNPDGTGALYGNWGQIGSQALAMFVTMVFSAVATTIVFKVSSLITGGARVDEEKEEKGLDEAIHGEQGFNY